MNKINFTITLKSDGEPGNGYGTELIDSLIPRNHENRIILPASHLKGIIRENLENLPEAAVPKSAINKLFGSPGFRADLSQSLFHIENALAQEDAKIIDITRTSLNKFGVAEDSSLRTTEAVAAGTVFIGSITTHPGLTKIYKNILKLGLLSLFAVGGARSRGAGACLVEIENETRTPGEILKQLADSGFNKPDKIDPIPISKSTTKPLEQPEISDEYSILKLTFKPGSPICVPDIPVVANNMIRTGIAIPASAVQGAVLYRINAICEKSASTCFENKHFRAWPMYPTDNKDNFPLCCSLSHKISKIKDEETHNFIFGDEIVKKTDSKEKPMRGVQGLLLTDGKKVRLWKANEIPRIITAHGVHNGDRGTGENMQKRNLFTVESLALPSSMFFTGIISLPQNIAELLIKNLKENPFVQLGKARSVRGGGKLSAEPVKLEELALMKKCEKKIFIVQSPLLIPQEFAKDSFENIISKLVAKSEFGEIEEAKGSISTQFGWNSRKKDGLIPAKAVIVQGTVFKLKQAVDNLDEKLIKGIGEGREQGFGAVLPHPGLAQELFKLPTELKTIEASGDNFGEEGFQLYDKAKESGLSASQISRLREQLSLGAEQALTYIDRQKDERPEKIWQRWGKVFEEIRDGIEKACNDSQYMEHMKKKLKVCQDLLVADKEDK
jgi:CRISPR/Cas system CSM-associated protein Csm3 (group 7 of RAMP superfamily)